MTQTRSLELLRQSYGLIQTLLRSAGLVVHGGKLGVVLPRKREQRFDMAARRGVCTLCAIRRGP